MNDESKQVFQQAMRLSPDERAELIEGLIIAETSAADLEELVAEILRRPAMYVGASDYNAIQAFIAGIHFACGKLLGGFHDWLAVRVNGFANHGWPNLVRIDFEKQQRAEPNDGQAIEHLNRLLREFFAYRRVNGVAKIEEEYRAWGEQYYLQED